MGLDMYLYLRKYESLGSWDKNASVEKALEFYPKELEEFARDIYGGNFMSKETKYQIGYWRKFNALHHWFVKSCAYGEDDCKPVYVDYEQLEGLLNIIKKVNENHSLAKELLPTSDGFFFGGQEYDEYYFYDIEYTLKLLTKVLEFLKTHDEYDVYYQASW